MKSGKMVKRVIGAIISLSLVCGSTMEVYTAYNDEITVEDMDGAENFKDAEDGNFELDDTYLVTI